MPITRPGFYTLVAAPLLVLTLITPAALAVEPATDAQKAQASDANGAANNTPAQDTAATGTEATQPKQPAAPQAATAPNYTPTEEISEDLSVSFPVDI
ncbi:hypothetical protein L1F30_10790 [Simiduia sp. 21SJ11W-1]|uniref:hypothetical protein n=1 Tax=Simiduia sp. 21SJ11W-1 TaxID=2909669 RepID=UPI00209E3F8F|nr:hypothetical protein [Simiduia sp. 21SJ11W-1]UTA46649.1 hypothetical protein L1F30_10790 [Simiduia sp. 21SJ11W-1]